MHSGNNLEQTYYLLRTVWQKCQLSLLPQDGTLSAHQLYFLLYLEKRQTCTPSDIAQDFGITLGAVTGFVDRLYKLELISRTRSEEDRRLVLIELTDKGREFLQAFAKEREAKFARILACMGQDQVDRLNISLSALNETLDTVLDED
ncbi:MAG TPA: MarR family transcriptional regulator [Verrucomicrobiae bacterium]|nr:MarR family transcriptional regulator [Verrucomicrobiae bacterium]